MDSGGGPADEVQTSVVPLLKSILEHGRHEMASLPIPDELVAEILLRLPTPADLVRASAGCVSFRRVAAKRSFLRRYRKLHAPPLLGFLERRKIFRPAIAPHPSASAASAVALAADFNFSFLPAPVSDWVVKDVRDDRVLLDRPSKHDISNRYIVVFPDLVVCDPLHRRYILLPPVPDNLVCSVEDPLVRDDLEDRHRHCETFLVPADNGDRETSAAEETTFRVIWMAQCRTKLVSFVFSSSAGQWRASSSQSWSNFFAGLLSSIEASLFSYHQYAYGCFYWVTELMEKLLVLDTRRMEFSIDELPPEARGLPGGEIAIVEAGKGRTGMFLFPQYSRHLNYSIRQNNCGHSWQWQFEKTISLDSGYMFMCSMGRHLLLYQMHRSAHHTRCFSLDVKTFQLERIFLSNPCYASAFPYISFPPSLLSTPTVSSGVENRAEMEMLEEGLATSSSAESPRSE